MRLSKTVQMTQALIEDTLALTQKGRSDAAEENFKTDVFPWAVNGQIEKNLQHIQMLMSGVLEDALNYEERFHQQNCISAEDGYDEASGKKIGKYYGMANE